METPFKRHEPLYLKHRPQSLAQLVGQEGVHRTLSNAIEHNRLSHAYLFTGPRGTGKTSSARILAKSLNCKTAGRPTVEPCQTCSCCVEITQGNSPAVFEIDAASNNSVDDARVLIERAPLMAVGGDYKVYIIDECHMLTKEAFNTLLKTIEEPPPKVVFILATTEEHKVLPTIVSRCQRLMFRLINQDALCKHLRHVADSENIEIEEDALKLIARRSGGGLRDALSNLDQAALLAAPGQPATVTDLLRLLGALHEDVLLDISRQVAQREGQAVIDSVSKLLGEGREPQVVLQELSRHFLALMKASYIAKTGNADGEALKSIVLGSDSYIASLLEQVSLFERSELSQIVEQLDRLEQTCRRSSQPAMHLEIGLLGICHRHEIHLVKDLLARVQSLEEKINSAAFVPDTHSHRPAPVAAQRPVAEPPPARENSAARPPINREQTEAAAPPPPASRPILPAQSNIATAPSANNDTSRAAQSNSSPAGDSRPAAKAAAPEPAAQLTSVADDDPRVRELNSDIDYVWQQILDELQRRHLPTYSLASTHAFPLQIGNREFGIGVMKENFQKMLEGKVEHIKTACQIVTGIDLGVRIRVTADAAPPAAQKKTAVASRPSSSPPPRDAAPSNEHAQSEGSSSNQAMTQEPVQSSTEEDPLSQQANSSESENTSENPGSNEFDATMVKEAYKLFEGPGSRRLS